MRQPKYLLDDASGRIELDRMLADGKGGEGSVFAIDGVADQVVKIYHAQPDTDQVRKLRHMCQSITPGLAKVTAWPSRVVSDPQSKRVVGFVMPRADGKPIWQLFHPPERARVFPFAAWNFQVRAAVNLAAAVEEVHAAGHVIGDFNLKNVFVAKNSLVRLIDCDSYQIRTPNRHYLCDIGMPDYTPPELQGNAPHGTGRTRNHDNFSLAVLIYQLLFLGRHPYAGQYLGRSDLPLFDAIREYRFCQGPEARSWDMAAPRFTPTFVDIPDDLGLLFRRAFERGSQRDSRPTPSEWYASIQLLEPQIVECEQDPSHRRWRGQRSCAWCRIESQVGAPCYFGAGGGAADTFEVDEATLQGVIRRLREIETQTFEYDRDQYALSETPAPQPPPDGLDEYSQIQTFLGVMASASALAALFGFVSVVVGMIGILSCLVFGVWFFCVWWQSPRRAELRRRRAIRACAERALLYVEDEWLECAAKYIRRDSELRKRIRERVVACRELENESAREAARLGANAKSSALDRHLRLHSILDADIEGIGMKRKYALISAGMRSAADIEADAILNLDGFGPEYTGRVMSWKAEVVRKFRFDPATAVSPKDRKELTIQFRRRQGAALSELESTLTELRTLTPAVRNILGKLVPQVREAIAEYEQANVDVVVMTPNR